MANFSITAETIWLHDIDMSGYLKKADAKIGVVELENTTFASGGYRSRIGGLRTVALAGDGFWDSTPDLSLFGAVGVGNRVVTISPQGAETNVAYLWRAAEFDYTQYGAVGDLTPFSITANSADQQGMIRGQMAAAKQVVSATGLFGSAVNLGLLGATQFLYASIHVFAAATTITIAINSGTSSGSTPTQRAIFPAFTTTGGNWLIRVAGPVATDTWWKFNVTANTGSFTLAGAIGIGS